MTQSLVCRQPLPRSRIGNQRGQAIVETGIVVVILVVLFTGIVEFGRAWMIVNMIEHSLRDGARMAAITPSTNRDATGHINGATKTIIGNQVLTEIQSVMPTATLNAPTITQTPGDPIPPGQAPLVTVRVTGTIPFVFGLFGASVPVDRSVTFRDEGRG